MRAPVIVLLLLPLGLSMSAAQRPQAASARAIPFRAAAESLRWKAEKQPDQVRADSASAGDAAVAAVVRSRGRPPM
jgi:hypothetical protein